LSKTIVILSDPRHQRTIYSLLAIDSLMMFWRAGNDTVISTINFEFDIREGSIWFKALGEAKRAV